jgi:hypothetical protein
MLMPLALALGSVAIGTALGIVRLPPRPLRGLHLLAAVATVLVVALELLPSAMRGAGVATVPLFVAGFAIPAALERLGARDGTLGLEVGFVGLLVHSVGDGLALGAYGGDGSESWNVLLAIAIHTVPVVAVVVLGFADRLGMAHALVRGALIGGAMAAGIAGFDALSPDHVERAEPWVAAAVGGLLAHVAFHVTRRTYPQIGPTPGGDA